MPKKGDRRHMDGKEQVWHHAVGWVSMALSDRAAPDIQISEAEAERRLSVAKMIIAEMQVGEALQDLDFAQRAF